MMWPRCTCYPLLYTSGCQITSIFSENVLGWLYYLFSQKKIFLFFRKISNNFLRKLDEKPKLHGYILPRQLSSWWSPARCTGCLKIWIQTFTSYNTKRLSYLRSMCCKVIITIRVNKEIKNLGMKCNKRIMKQAWPNQFRHI